MRIDFFLLHLGFCILFFQKLGKPILLLIIVMYCVLIKISPWPSPWNFQLNSPGCGDSEWHLGLKTMA